MIVDKFKLLLHDKLLFTFIEHHHLCQDQEISWWPIEQIQ